MDALKLHLRAKDQLHPILQELVTGYARFKGSKDWEGRGKMVAWLITLNGMKASEELTDDQCRQVNFFLSSRSQRFSSCLFVLCL
jgi:ESCRT-I complex subunit VPS28